MRGVLRIDLIFDSRLSHPPGKRFKGHPKTTPNRQIEHNEMKYFNLSKM